MRHNGSLRSSAGRKRFARSSTVWIRPSCSNGRSTSTRTTATATSCARSSRSRRWTGHSTELEEMDVEGILAFAERVLPSASNLYVGPVLVRSEAATAAGVLSRGDSFDGKRLVGTGTTLPVFNYLSPVSEQKKDL